ncbi:MAG: ArsR/SmtB family transcription factor [Myxococcota bacterium]
MTEDKKTNEMIRVFKALSDPVRIEVIRMLSCKEMCARKLLEGLQISQSTLSYHMKILTESELILAQKKQTRIHYSINKSGFDNLHSFLKNLTAKKADCIFNDKNSGCKKKNN